MPWNAETPGVPTDTPACIAFGGKLHVFSANNVRLDHFSWDPAGGTWSQEHLDVGATTLAPAQIAAIEYQNALHLFYRAHSMAAGNGIRHGWFDGGWHFETLDSPNTRATTCSVVQFNGQLHVFNDQGSGVMHHAWFDLTRWNFEFLDMVPNGSSGVDAAAIVFSGNLHVFSLPSGAGPGIRHAFFDRTWHFETLDLTPSLGGFSASLFNGNLHLFSALGGPMPATAGIRHGSFDGAAWQFETLDAGSSHGGGAAVTYGGQLHIFGTPPRVAVNEIRIPGRRGFPERRIPVNLSLQGIRHGWFDGAAWNFESLDSIESAPALRIVATAFTPTGGQARLDAFTWLNSTSAPTALRHVFFVP